MRRRAVVAAFEGQARASERMGSPMYGHLLAQAARDIERGGAVGRLVGGWQGDPVALALPLRLMATLHEQVLAGALPALAHYYPSAGGLFEPDGAWQAMRDGIEQEEAALRPLLERPLQTNEVRRSALLLSGILTIAAEQNLPLRLLEIGASAGLNLNWAHYNYRLGEVEWGAAESPVNLSVRWHGPPPPLLRPEIHSRLGSDPEPIDLAHPNAAHRLLAFIWPDQPKRIARLRAAIAVARERPPPLVRAGAADFAAAQLARPEAGVVTVLYHSVVWQYLPPAEQVRLTEIIREAGARADSASPLAWLRMEAGADREAALMVDQWPGGQHRLLARSQWHVRWIDWLGE